MSADIATLGLEIRSDGVVVASDRLRQLTNEGRNAEASTARLSSSFGNLTNYIKTAAAALGAYKLFDLAKDAALLAARYETLSVVMNTVGATAGYTNKQMAGFQAQLQKSGIAMIESRQVLTQMAQAHLDLSKASQLSRVAQDAATIGGINSSEAFERLVSGIQKGETEILKTIGINVNFQQSYEKLASQLGKSVNSLNETEKATARMNSVLDRGKDIAGVYEAAMGTAGKQLTSMKRYMDNLKVTMGSVFNDVLIVGVQAFTGGLKDANTEAEKLQREGQLKSWGENLVMIVATVADGLMIAYHAVNTLVITGVAGFTQLYYGAKAFGQALLMDFAGAGESFDNLMNTGAAWSEMIGKEWENSTRFQDSAKKMFAERASDANVQAEKEKAALLERTQLSGGAASRDIEQAAQLAELVKKNRAEWGGIVVSQLESVGQFEKAAQLQIELNKQTDEYKALLNASKDSKEAQAALDAQALLDKQKLVDAEKKSLELTLAKKSASASAMQQLIQLTTANGGDTRGLQATQLQMEYEKKRYEYSVQLAEARKNENDIAANITEQNLSQLDALYSQRTLSDERMDTLRGVLGLEQSITAQKQQQVSAATQQAQQSQQGSTWGWDDNGDLINPSASLTGGGVSIRGSMSPTSNVAGDISGVFHALRERGIAESVSAGGSFMAQIWNNQSETTGTISEAATAAIAYAKAVATATDEMNNDLVVRQLMLNGQTEEATLTKKRIDQQKELNKAIDDGVSTSQLVLIQQAEYNKLLHEQQLAKVIKDTETFFSKVKSAIADLTASGKTLVTSLLNAASALRGASGDLSTGSTTNLSNTALYALNRSNLANTVQQAMSTGDAELYAKIPGLVSAFLEQSRSYNASGAQYGADFTWAKGLLDTSATAAEDAAAHAGAVISAAEKQQTTLDAIKLALTTDNAAALPKLYAELSSNSGVLKTAFDAATTALGASGAIATGVTGVSTAVGGVSTNVTGVTTALTGGTGSVTGWLSSVNTQTGEVKAATDAIIATTSPLTAISTNTYYTNANLTNGAGTGYLSGATNRGKISSVSTSENYNLSQPTSAGIRYPLSATSTTSYAYFAKGGISDVPAIFGEAGAEAAVPLPDGRTIPVTLSGTVAADNKETVAELKAIIRTLQAGFNAQIDLANKQVKNSESLANSARLQAAV